MSEAAPEELQRTAESLGIALAPLGGGYRSSFAWGWRPLAEIP